MEIAYFVVLNCLGHLAFVGVRMTTSLFALGLGSTEAAVGVLMALFALLPMLRIGHQPQNGRAPTCGL